MKKDSKINRRQFLNISLGFCTGAFISNPLFDLCKLGIIGAEKSHIIKIIGVGGAGGNAINNMIDSKLMGVKFIAANTDIRSLKFSKAETKILMGEKITEGLGASADPVIGREAALENKDTLREELKDSNMVFIIAGFGGGTGTGAVPVIAKICKDLEIKTIAVVSKPFSFEGKKRTKQAEEGINAVKEVVDTVVTISNDRLRWLVSKDARMLEMFKKADEIICKVIANRAKSEFEFKMRW